MGTAKNTNGNCPYCNGECEANAEQNDNRYETQECEDCEMHSARKRETFISYPLVNPADPNSGWVVYNPNVEPTRA